MSKPTPAQLRALDIIARRDGAVVVLPDDMLFMLTAGWLEWYGGEVHITDAGRDVLRAAEEVGRG